MRNGHNTMKKVIIILILFAFSSTCYGAKIYTTEGKSKVKEKTKKIKQKDKDDLISYLISKGKDIDKIKDGIDYTDVDLADMLREQLGASL